MPAPPWRPGRPVRLPGRIALLGFGEVGQSLASGLREHVSVKLIAWDTLFVDPASPAHRHARQAGVQTAGSAGEAVAAASLIISAVTNANSVTAAEAAAPALMKDAVFLDLNSIAPSAKLQAARLIDAGGGRFIEAAVLGPIRPRGLATPMLFGGAHAEAFLPSAHALGMSAARLFSSAVGPASAVKMCRSVIVKGLEALLTESLAAARYYGVEETVLASLGDMLPNTDWPALARYMLSRSLVHGRRRADEMLYVAQTVAETGIEPWMSRASLHRQAWAGDHASVAGRSSLPEMLDGLLHSRGTGDAPNADH